MIAATDVNVTCCKSESIILWDGSPFPMIGQLEITRINWRHQTTSMPTHEATFQTRKKQTVQDRFQGQKRVVNLVACEITF